MDKRTIDITQIDIRNESLKLKNQKAERDLLSIISEKGVMEPLLGFFDGSTFVLIDGFKRFQCCRKLHINTVPIEVVAANGPEAFIKAIKISNNKSLHILEQAKFLKKLKDGYEMTATDIGKSLGKSLTWVSRRLTLLKQLTPLQEDKIFKGEFPVWNMMGLLHQLQSCKLASPDEVDEFISAVSGKGLVGKDIDLLANGYFKGGKEFKEQIKNGNFAWSLNKIKDTEKKHSGLKDEEKRFLKDLEISSKYIGRIIFKVPQLQVNNNLTATGGLLAEGILNKLDRFKSILSDFVKEGKNDQQR